MTIHKFDVDIATEFGIVEAIVFQYFAYWIFKNEQDNRVEDFHDNKWWTYGTASKIAENFPYLSEHQVRRAIAKLVEKEALQQGNYNKRGFDRTIWYTFGNAINTHFANLRNAFCESAKWNLQNREMEFAKTQNAFCESAKAIPYINNTVNKPISKPINIIADSSAGEFNPISVFEQTFLFINRDVAERLEDLRRTCGLNAIEKAFARAIDNKVSAWGAIGYIEKVAKAIASGNDFAERVKKRKNDVVAAAEKAQQQMDAEGGNDNDDNSAECSDSIWGIWSGE